MHRLSYPPVILPWLTETHVNGKLQTLILEHPPRKEWEEFNQLKRRHDELVGQTNQLQRSLRKAETARSQAVAHEQALRHGRHRAGQVVSAERQLQQRSAQESDLASAWETARTELAALDAKGYDFKKPFAMECLAFRTGQTRGGKAVYDRGVVN